jgi:4-hydroxy-3-polyprenylbenzoate decarboxylase
MQRRLIVGITGASGVVYGVRLLQALRHQDIETHLVLTRSAALTITYELDQPVDAIKALATKVHPIADVGASIASGSYRTDGMIIAPCSMHTLAAIATGVCDNLLTRAADVVLKERRRLVLLVRETPLHLGHLRNMTAVTEMGAIVSPPVPAFYGKPKTIDDLVDHTIGRALDLFDIDTRTITRWREHDEPSREE